MSDFQRQLQVKRVVDGCVKAGTVACVLANGFEVGAKVRRADFVMANSREVGVAPGAIPYLALLEGAGTAGLIVGLLGAPKVGLVAAIGLDLFFCGAVSAHVRAHVLHNIGFPAAFLSLAVASTTHFARHLTGHMMTA